MVAVGVVLLAAVASGTALVLGDDDEPAAAPLTVGWGGTEGHPSCVYDASDRTVFAKIRIDGRALRRQEVTVTVTAYADENTSEPVGSNTRSVRVEGTAHERILITIPVQGKPHVDVDGETACALSVKY